MDADLHIPVTSNQQDLIQEATVDEPEGMAAWPREVLMQAARRKLDQKESGKHNAPSPERTSAELARQWKAGRSTTSTVKRMAAHPAYFYCPRLASGGRQPAVQASKQRADARRSPGKISIPDNRTTRR